MITKIENHGFDDIWPKFFHNRENYFRYIKPIFVARTILTRNALTDEIRFSVEELGKDPLGFSKIVDYADLFTQIEDLESRLVFGYGNLWKFKIHDNEFYYFNRSPEELMKIMSCMLILES